MTTNKETTNDIASVSTRDSSKTTTESVNDLTTASTTVATTAFSTTSATTSPTTTALGTSTTEASNPAPIINGICAAYTELQKWGQENNPTGPGNTKFEVAVTFQNVIELNSFSMILTFSKAITGLQSQLQKDTTAGTVITLTFDQNFKNNNENEPFPMTKWFRNIIYTYTGDCRLEKIDC
ncbi:unnamed protein product [Meganyctiphanes norvegica]|uniref:SEA domain-containing protein n=1 Tax=Meganyctiphanes norvegica TaxID=48144 RepID=A0AAV2SB89_MEGNR